MLLELVKNNFGKFLFVWKVLRMLIGGSEGRINGIKLDENALSVFSPKKNVDV